MNVYQIALFALLALSVTGCSQERQQSASGPEATAAEPQPETNQPQADKSIRGALQEALPLGVQLHFEHHVRNDMVLEREGRRDRRRVGLEYLSGDQGATFASLESSMTAAGLNLRDRKEMENGNIRAKFTKPGYGTVVVTVTKGMGDVRSRNAAAIGRVMLDWPLPAKGEQ